MSTHSGTKDYARFDELAEEFAKRYRQGERPSLQEYVDRFPEMADEIRELFPAFIEVEQADEVRHDRAKHGVAAPSTPSMPPLGQVGDYRILREVGRGGMGVVYEAEQVSLGRRVALKVLPRHVARDRRTLERFRREARSAAKLHHTNIVPVFEVGQDSEIVFYAMQFIQGQGLDLVIDELARLRARSSAPAIADLSNGPGDFLPDLVKSLSLADVLTMTDASRPPKPDPRLGLMAHSLLTGGLPGGEPESSCQPVAASTASSTFAGARTEGLNSELTACFDRADLDQARRGPLSLEESLSPAVGVSSSTMLPGGTQISSIESSGRLLPFFRGVAQIGRQVALGLAYAHARGVVHRDIKPSNLLLDTAGVVWITDFGLAKGEDDGLTATGDILGTLRYMAPERFRGEGDARADVYALGLTIYELLTLRPAFGAADRLRLVEQIKTEEPVPPRTIDHRIPRDLETIILKATDKDLDRRYPSAAALAEDLRRFIDDEPIEARRASYREQMARWARHHKEIAVSLGVIFVLLVLAVVAAGLAAASFRRIASDKTWLANQNDLERIKALKAKSEADVARALAEEQRETAVRTLYFAKANPVSEALATPLGWSRADSFLMAWRGLNVRNDPRAWEWYYLQNPSDHERMTLRGHRVDVLTVAVSPDGTRIASGGFDDAIRIWDKATGKQIVAIEARGRGVICLRWSPDGTRIADASTDRRVRVWDATLGLNLMTVAGHPGLVRSVAWSPDGTRIASKGDHDRIRIWDASTGRQLLKTGEESYKGSVLWSPDGTRLATWCMESSGLISIWNASTGAKDIQLGTESRKFEQVAWSPDGTRIVSFEEDGVVKVWDAAAGKMRKTLEGKRDLIKSLSWNQDGTRLASGHQNGIITIWNAVDWQPRFDLRSTSLPNALSWSPDGRQLVSGHGGWNGEVNVWRVDEEVLKSIRVTPASVTPAPLDHSWSRALAWSPRGAKLAVAKSVGTVEVWDVATGRETTLPYLGEFWPTTLAWSPDNNRLAVGLDHEGGFVKIVDVTTGKELADLRGERSTIRTISWSPDGRRLAIGEAHWKDGPLPTTAVILWDASNYKQIEKFAGSAALWSPDGTRILVSGQYSVQILDASTRATLARWEQPQLLNWSFCWSPDSRLVAGTYERDVYVWESATGRPAEVMTGHAGVITSCAWNPDGQRLATASADGTVRLWDTQSGSPVFTLHSHQREVLSVAWSADGLRLASGGLDGTIRLWDATRGSEIDRDPARLPSLDARVAADSSDIVALGARADLRARLERWDEAASDYDRLARALAVKAPLWFQAGWWSSSSLKGVSDSAAPTRTISDPFALAPATANRPAGDPTRPRWYGDADDPNGFLPISKNPPYLTTRVYCPQECLTTLAVDMFPASVWVNGAALRQGPTMHPVTLRKGWNSLVAKLEIPQGESTALSLPRIGLYFRLSSGTADLAAAYLQSEQPERAVEIAKPATDDVASLLLAYRTSVEYAASLRRAGKDEAAKLEETRALELLERLITSRPDAGSLIGELATLLVNHLAEWTRLEPVELKSQGGATLTVQSDGSILASGPNADHDTYTLVVKTDLKHITGLRLEALDDPRLPGNGAGREIHGNFRFTGLDVMLQGAANEPPRLVPLGDKVSIGTKTWLLPAIEARGGGRGSTMTVIIKHETYPSANLGRFRLSASTCPDLDLLVAMASAKPGPQMTTETVVGVADLVDGNAREAIAHLRHTGDQKSGGLVIDQLVLFLAYEQLGEGSIGRSYLERALDRLEKEHREDEDILANVLVEALTKALETSRDDLRILTLRARALQRLGRREAAVADIRRAAELDSENPEWPLRRAQLDPEVLNAWNFDFGLDGWQAENQVTLMPVDGTFLKVESTGDDPQMTVPVAVPAGKMKLSVRARLGDPIHARLYWSTRDQQAQAPYSKERSVPVELSPTSGNWREFAVVFESKAPLTGLRLDLGGAGNLMEIDSIVLRMDQK